MRSRRNIAGAPCRSTRSCQLDRSSKQGPLERFAQPHSWPGKRGCTVSTAPPTCPNLRPKTLQCDRACLDSARRAGYDAFRQETNVTLEATANSSDARETANPALRAALAITAVAAATLAGAWFFQLVLDIRPCPLCLEQRYAYYLAIPLGLLVAFVAAKDAPRPVLLAGLALLLIAALANAWLGTYHAGVEWKFWQGPTDCTGPVGNLGSAGSLLRSEERRVG